MPSSWNIYYVIFLSAVLALGIPAALALFSRVFSPNRPKKRLNTEVLDEVPAVNESVLGKRINARFFLGVNASLVLLALVLILIPCAGMIHSGQSQIAVLRGLLAIVSVAGFASLGLFYSSKKGDLGWLRSFQKDGDA